MTKVIIVIGGGMIETVYSDQEIDLEIIDLDCADPNERIHAFQQMDEAAADPTLKGY